jgi:SAM-dependent methyltransferase
VSSLEQLRDAAAAYYAARLDEHGPTAAGVDWNGAASQTLRFDQLLRVVDGADRTLLDFGCGYGALVDHLAGRGVEVGYVGYDAAPSMVAAARALHPAVTFTSDLAGLAPVDHVVASGVLNVRGTASRADWEAYAIATVEQVDRLATRGFAFNLLTSYVDWERDDLYHADPGFWFDLCKRRFSRQVALLHDYGLWEFTIIVRKETP